MTVACDQAHSFYVDNETELTYFIRVITPARDPIAGDDVPERRWVYEIEPLEAGYVGRFVVSGFGEGGWAIDLLDSECTPVESWQMPDGGGHLQISDGGAEFTAGYYFEETPSGESPPEGSPSDGTDAWPFESVLECDATDRE